MRLVRFFLPMLSALALLAAPARNASPGVQAALSRLPLRFEANAGQWNSAVRFAAHADRYSVLLTPAGASLAMASGQRLDLALERSNPAAEMEGEGRVPIRTDYFLGAKDRWRTSVPAFSRVVYRGVYPGIDVAYYGNANCLEYDFRVEPGADPSSIRLRVYGAGRVSVGEQGDLVVDTDDGQLLQKLPLIYQTDSRTGARRIVEGRYTMLGPSVVGFRLSQYDRSRPLVIDPYLVYSSYWGGASSDQVNAVKAGSNGLLYVLGRTLTSDLIATSANYAAGNVRDFLNDMFILVLDTTAAGNYSTVYMSYLGGTADEFPEAIKLDASGNLFITGTTTSADFPMAGNSVQRTALSTTSNAFVVEFNPNAASTDALVYSTFLGGSADNQGQDIAVDKNGLIYVIGSTTSSDFPVTANGYGPVLWGVEDAFLCQIDPTNALINYATYLGGENADEGRSIAVDSNGLVYFGIVTDSAQFPLGFPPGGYPFSTTLAGDRDIIVGVMDMTKIGNPSLVWDTYFGGSDDDEVRKIALSATGKILVTGYTFSQDFPVTADAVQPMPLGESDAFASIIDPFPPAVPRALVYSTYFGGSDGEVSYDITGDTSGVVYLTGYTFSPDFPVTPDAVQTTYGGGSSIFVAKLKPGVSGKKGVLFSTFIGGVGNHLGTSLSLGFNGEVFVGGITSLGLPAAGDNAQIYGGGYNDGFVLTLTQLAGQPVETLRAPISRTPGSPPPVVERTSPTSPRGIRHQNQ